MNNLYAKLLNMLLITLPIFLLGSFYNSIVTLALLITVVMLFIMLLYTNKGSRKNVKYIIAYFSIVLVYYIFHHLNSNNFNSLVPGNFNYNLYDEILQIAKLCVPILFIYIIRHTKINKMFFIKLIKYYILFVAGSIVITNIFVISESSYADQIIKGNIFSWFSNGYYYADLASKGYFMYANQICLILNILFVISFYYFINKKINFNYIILIIIASLMLGTRVSSIGLAAIFIVVFIFTILYKITKQIDYSKKDILKTISLMILFGILLPYSPSIRRVETYDLLNAKTTYILAYEEKLEEKKELSKEEYIEENYEELKINANFIINRYPYQYDPDFWYEILQQDESSRTNYRYLETEMIKRVIEINDNNNDVFFGITNSRVQNIFNIESDITLQYYAYGIIGLILFLGIYIYQTFKMTFAYFKTNKYYHFIKASICAITFFIAYLSGNIFNQLVPLLLVSLFMFIEFEENKGNNKRNLANKRKNSV